MSRRNNGTPPSPQYEEWEDEQEEWYRNQQASNDGWGREPSQEMYERWLSQDNITPPQAEQQQQRRDQELEWNVHDVFNNIRDNEKEIIETLGGPNTDLFLFQIGPEQLLIGFHDFCIRIIKKHYTSPKLEEELDKLRQITSKLNLAKHEYLQNANICSVFTAIQFVIRQPDVFQKYYVDLFIEDTFYAYDRQPDALESSISCPRGIVERMLFAIADACLLYCTAWKKKLKQKKNRTKRKKGGGKNTSQYKRCTNPIYRKLIRLFKKEVPDINQLTKEWALIFEEAEVVGNMSAEELKKNFIAFMTRKYQAYGLTQTELILQRANQFEELHVFERKGFI
jgi:hypothetical protein